MNKAALYCRLSKEDTGKDQKESSSIIHQKQLLHEYAKSHGYEIYDYYIDDDFSGLFTDRPDFKRLITDARAKKFDLVIAKSQSRFTRNMEHVERYLHTCFPSWGIRFIGVADGTDTSKEENKKARQIYALTNEWYCEDLSNSIHAVFQQKMKKGEFIGSFAPYGYKKDPCDKNKLIIDEQASAVVRKIYELYAAGMGIEKICRILTEENILTPANYKQREGLTYRRTENFQNIWSYSTVSRMLQNETYLGKVIQGKMRKTSYKSRQLTTMPKEKWYVAEEMHPPVIEEELFQKVQLQRKTKRRATKRTKEPNILAGKLHCASCGSPLVSTGGYKKEDIYEIYYCCSLSKKTAKKECTPHRIRNSQILDEVKSILTEQLDVFLNKNGSPVCFHEDSKVSKLEKEHEQLQKALQMLYLDRAGEIIDEDTYNRLFQDMTDKMRKVKKMLSETSSHKGRELSPKCIIASEYIGIFIKNILVEEAEPAKNIQKLKIIWNF